MKIKTKTFATLIIIGFCGIIPLKSEAAVFSFETERESVALGENFAVSLFLDTRNQEINTLKGKIIFPKDFLEFEKISQENSIVSFWVDPPKHLENGEISFSGIIPGGFSGESGSILKIFFEAKKIGLAELDMKEVEVLLNDSRGTRLNTIFSKKNISIAKTETPGGITPDSWEDKEPPESFQISAASHQDVFEGKWFAAFEARDNGSGINHYEVQETRSGEPREDKWVKIERGPFLLSDQNLGSYVFVKAIDKENNARMEMLYPPRKPDYLKYFLAVLVGATIVYFSWNVFRKKILLKKLVR